MCGVWLWHQVCDQEVTVRLPAIHCLGKFFVCMLVTKQYNMIKGTDAPRVGE